MSTLSKISVIITSGGNSTRFGSNKLLAKIESKSVIETTISKFINLADEIIIPCSDEIKKAVIGSDIFCNKIKFAPSGKTRQMSVYNGIMQCTNPDIVLIHDGARPFVEEEIIKKVINASFENQAAIAGVFATDTIKEVKNGKITKTLNRENIFFAHTPQGFKYELIKKIHEKYKDNPNFTDDSSMAEAYGISVYVVEDFKNNTKITTKDDLL